MIRNALRWVLPIALLTLILLFPLRWLVELAGLERAGLSARSVSGSVWDGRLEQAQLGGFELGSLDAQLSPGPLLLGRARLNLVPAGEQNLNPAAALPGIRGSVERRAGGRTILTGLDGLATRGRIGAVPLRELRFAGVNLDMGRDGCRAASGRVTMVPALSFGPLTLSEGFTGAIRCDGRNLELPLASSGGNERLTLTLAPDGSYSARLGIGASDPLVGAALGVAGFQPVDGAWVRVIRGRL